MNQLDLAGRVAVVTGGAQGIGQAVAQRLAVSGADVALWDIDSARLRSAALALRAQGTTVSTAEVELIDEASVQAASDLALQTYGHIDVLFNSAGITGGNAPSWELSPQAWWRVLEVNLVGPYLTSRAVVPVIL